MATVAYDSKTGKKLSAGQSTIVNGVSVKAGSTYNPSPAPAPAPKTTSSGGGSSSSISTPINIDSNPGQSLAPGQVYTYQGKTYTQPGGTTTTAPATTTTTSTPVSAANLKVGSTGSDVANLQTFLNTQGAGLTVDGKLGPLTDAAIKAYQRANGLTADGIVGVNTSAKMNGVQAPAPLTMPINNTVPISPTPPYVAPIQDSPQLVDSYYQGITQSVANLTQQLEQERQRNLERIQVDKQQAQEALQNVRDTQEGAINEQGALSIEEKQKKLDALDLETKRFDENYATVQGLGNQLMDLMSQGNALIASQKGVTGLGVIRNPRVAETVNNITAQVGVLKAGIDVFNGQMNQAQTQLQLATNTLTSAYSDQIDYYKSISDFYESVAKDNQAEVVQLTQDERAYLDNKITSLEADRKRVMDNADAIQNAMMDPDTALAYASAGVTLNDSPQVINQKLARYAYSKELADQSNDMASNGYTALVSGNPPAGSEVVRITDSQGKVKTYWKKGSGDGSTTSSSLFDDVMQAAIDAGASPSLAALKAVEYAESKGIQLSKGERDNLVLRAKNLKPTVVPVDTTPAPVPVTAKGAGQAINSAVKPLYEAFRPENLGQGAKDVASGVGSFFSGLFGF